MKNLLLTDLIQRIDELEHSKKDYLIDSSTLTLETEDQACYLTIPIGRYRQTVRLTDTARQQLTSRLDIPWAFAERLRQEHPELLDRTVNTLLRKRPEQRLLRTLSGDSDTCRAYLSPNYKILDNGDFLGAILPLFSQRPDFTLQEGFLTDSHLQMTILIGERPLEVRPGDAVRYGIVLLNSEVGLGSLSVTAFIHRLVCSNGLVVPEQHGSLRRIHLGRRISQVQPGYADRSLWRDYAANVKEMAAGNHFPALVERIRQAADMPLLTESETIVEDIGKRFTLTKDEKSIVLEQYEAGRDRSIWGLVNAVTETAKEATTIQRRNELQTIGGKLLPQIKIPQTLAAA